MLGADVRLGEGATHVLPDGRRRRRHPLRAGGRRPRCSCGAASAGSRSGARSSSPGGCATPRRRPLAGGHRHQRQDHHRADARHILRTAGLRSVAVGNVGLPIVEAVMDPAPYDVFAVELSSFQLHYTDSMARRGRGGAERRRGPSRLVPGDVRSTPPTRAASTQGVSGPASTTPPTRPDACAWSRRPTSEGARAIGFTLGTPGGRHQLGVVEDILVDRAFIDERQNTAAGVVHTSPTWALRPRTTCRTPWQRPPSPGPTGSRQQRYATG